MIGFIIGVSITSIILLFLVIFYICTSNEVNKILVKIKESESSVEIQLKRRYDILTQSIEVAKGYMNHKEKVFTNLRNVYTGMGIVEINKALKNQATISKELVALAEEYPELRSEELFFNLQNQLTEENAQLFTAKRDFNANITRLNVIVVSFPSSIVCNMKKQKEMEFIHENNLESIKDIDFNF